MITKDMHAVVPHQWSDLPFGLYQCSESCDQTTKLVDIA